MQTQGGALARLLFMLRDVAHSFYLTWRVECVSQPLLRHFLYDPGARALGAELMDGMSSSRTTSSTGNQEEDLPPVVFYVAEEYVYRGKIIGRILPVQNGESSWLHDCMDCKRLDDRELAKMVARQNRSVCATLKGCSVGAFFATFGASFVGEAACLSPRGALGLMYALGWARPNCLQDVLTGKTTTLEVFALDNLLEWQTYDLGDDEKSTREIIRLSEVDIQ